MENANRSPEVLRHTKHTILEIGCEGGSFLSGSLKRRQLKQNEKYIGLDFNAHIGESRGFLSAIYPGQIDFIKGDGRKLPFADKTIDEVVACNLLGDPRTDRNSIIQEAIRTLKSDGEITIVESYSPTVFTLDHLKREMDSLGLVQTNVGEEENSVEAEKYVDIENNRFYIAKFRLKE